MRYKVSTPVGNCYVTETSETKAVVEAIKRKYGRRIEHDLVPSKSSNGGMKYTGTVLGRFKGVYTKKIGVSITITEIVENGTKKRG